jgi:hypothetical protein
MPKPTTRQLSYLRSLAERTGQTFSYPNTRARASAEIRRLKGVAPQSAGQRRYERKLIADQVATGLSNTGVAEDEIAGHGSEATWRQNRQRADRIVSSHQAPRRQAGPVVGTRTELARYTVAHGGERILYGQRVDGTVRVTDRPAGTVSAQNRAHLIETGLTTTGELDALVADYVARAAQLQAVPAAATPFDRALAELIAR